MSIQFLSVLSFLFLHFHSSTPIHPKSSSRRLQTVTRRPFANRRPAPRQRTNIIRPTIRPTPRVFTVTTPIPTFAFVPDIAPVTRFFVQRQPVTRRPLPAVFFTTRRTFPPPTTTTTTTTQAPATTHFTREFTYDLLNFS